MFIQLSAPHSRSVCPRIKLRLSGTGIAREERLLQCAFVPGASDEPMAVAVADFTASKEASVHLYPDEEILLRCQAMPRGGALPFRLMLRPLMSVVPTQDERTLIDCFRDFMSAAEKETTAHHRPGPAAAMMERRLLADQRLHAADSRRELRALYIQFSIGRILARVTARASVIGACVFPPDPRL